MFCLMAYLMLAGQPVILTSPCQYQTWQECARIIPRAENILKLSNGNVRAIGCADPISIAVLQGKLKK